MWHKNRQNHNRRFKHKIPTKKKNRQFSIKRVKKNPIIKK